MKDEKCHAHIAARRQEDENALLCMLSTLVRSEMFVVCLSLAPPLSLQRTCTAKAVEARRDLRARIDIMLHCKKKLATAVGNIVDEIEL